MNNLIGLIGNSARIIDNDPWTIVQNMADEALQPYQILSVSDWRRVQESSHPLMDGLQLGIWLQPDEDPAEIAPWVNRLPIIALSFESFLDGRAYSQAYLLRSRYGFKGELRAIGDVLRDQLAAMRHCGFTAFAVRADKSVVNAMEGLKAFDLIYARSVTNPEPLFKRRPPKKV